MKAILRPICWLLGHRWEARADLLPDGEDAYFVVGDPVADEIVQIRKELDRRRKGSDDKQKTALYETNDSIRLSETEREEKLSKDFAEAGIAVNFYDEEINFGI